MRKPRLQWKLFAAMFIPVLAALAVIGWYASGTMRRLYMERQGSDMEVRARLMDELLPDSLPVVPSSELMQQVRQLARLSEVRITITNTEGRVTADSQEPHGSESVTYAPEIREALIGNVGVSQRYSSTSRAELLYVAVPLNRQGKFVGALRIAVPVAEMAHNLRQFNRRIFAGGALITVIAAFFAFFYARRVSRPIERMKRSAEHFAEGDFSTRLDVPGTAELSGLAITLNRMAERLDGEIRTVTRQRNEQQAILLSLREGVIALDTHESVLFINHAASSLLRLDPERAKGRLLQEVCRISELHRFAKDFLHGSGMTADTEIRMSAQPPQIIQIRGTELYDSTGMRMGALIVLNDVTTVRRLEELRRDFVANVSHELKTPITAIKGFIETLRDDDTADARTVPEFLERIARNADRLNVIVEDLLSLSRIEQESEQGLIERWERELKPIAESAVTAVQAAARERQIIIRLTCPESITAFVNPMLLEQALVNLLDNAVKYSDPDRTVNLDIERSGGEILIRVRDQGWGIEAQHLPRLFERFYCADKARSRKLGGTGLGLAIVKHIAQAHGGHIQVESTPGIGSTFTVILPSAEAAIV